MNYRSNLISKQKISKEDNISRNTDANKRMTLQRVLCITNCRSRTKLSDKFNRSSFDQYKLNGYADMHLRRDATRGKRLKGCANIFRTLSQPAQISASKVSTCSSTTKKEYKRSLFGIRHTIDYEIINRLQNTPCSRTCSFFDRL